MEEEEGGRRAAELGGRWWPLVVLTVSPFHGHMTPTLQLATALHAKGFSIAIAHSTLNPPHPSNHPNHFIFLPLSDNLSAIDSSASFTHFLRDLNSDTQAASLRRHLTRLMSEKDTYKSTVIIYDNLMFFAGAVAIDLNLAAIVFCSCSAAYFPAFLARRQLDQQGKYRR